MKSARNKRIMQIEQYIWLMQWKTRQIKMMIVQNTSGRRISGKRMKMRRKILNKTCSGGQKARVILWRSGFELQNVGIIKRVGHGKPRRRGVTVTKSMCKKTVILKKRELNSAAQIVLATSEKMPITCQTSTESLYTTVVKHLSVYCNEKNN